MAWLDDDFEDAVDFQLFGLTSALGSHRLCWELNRKFGWGLAFFRTWKRPGGAGMLEQEEPLYVAHRYHSPAADWDVMILLNRSEGIPLLSKVAGVDYLLRVVEGSNDTAAIPRQLKAVPWVTWIGPLDVVKTGALEHLAVLNGGLDQ